MAVDRDETSKSQRHDDGGQGIALHSGSDHFGEARLGLVELSIEAGLKRTALGMLEKAVQKNPRCVSLLSALAAQLRSLGRDTEAEEVEARYAALRFDDAEFLSQKVELAVARRDAAGAERWLNRFLGVDAGSAWARGLAARTYRALGQKDRALATYQQALAIVDYLYDRYSSRRVNELIDRIGESGDVATALRETMHVSLEELDRAVVEHLKSG